MVDVGMSESRGHQPQSDATKTHCIRYVIFMCRLSLPYLCRDSFATTGTFIIEHMIRICVYWKMWDDCLFVSRICDAYSCDTWMNSCPAVVCTQIQNHHGITVHTKWHEFQFTWFQTRNLRFSFLCVLELSWAYPFSWNGWWKWNWTINKSKIFIFVSEREKIQSFCCW